jgi:hypothetical protein
MLCATALQSTGRKLCQWQNETRIVPQNYSTLAAMTLFQYLKRYKSKCMRIFAEWP